MKKLLLLLLLTSFVFVTAQANSYNQVKKPYEWFYLDKTIAYK